MSEPPSGGTAGAEAAPLPPPLPPLSPLALIGLSIGAAMTTFVVILDLTIANVSIPSIAAGLGSSPREGTWVITSYAVAEAITVLMSGWLSGRFGLGRVMVASLLGFGVTSMACGLAPNLDTLVIFRALQGLAGGPLAALAQTALLVNFPKDKAPTAMAIWTAMGVLGPISGPIIGGFICDHWSWPWIFLINVPIILVVSVLLWRILGPRDPKPKRTPIDYVGISLMATAVVATQMMLDRGHDLDWFHSPMIVAFLVVSIVSSIAFLMWELTEEHPFVNLGLLRNGSFTAALLVLCFWFAAFFGSVIISPLWLQTNMNYTATWAGLANAPTGIVMIIMAPIVAWLTNRMDARVMVSLGMAIAASTFILRGHFIPAVGLEQVLLIQIGVGVGLSLIFAPSLSIAFDSLPPQEIANGNALITFVRTIFVAVATSSFVTYWQTASVKNRVGMVDRIEGHHAVGQITAVGMPHEQALWYLDGLVQVQAIALATNDTYMIFAALSVIAGIIIWFAPRPHRARKRS
jgi:DHA2 family multidrug resistance protein